MKEILKNKKIIITIFIIVLMIFLTLLLIFLTKKSMVDKPPSNDGDITPTQVVVEYKRPKALPPELKTIPTLMPAKGKGLDLQSEIIKDSIIEIDKLKGKLPYLNTITSGNTKVEIVIPESKYQDNNYTLQVNLNGIDFKLASDSNDYFENREAFIASARDVFNLLKQNNIDVKKIIIKWGDRTFTNDKANIWLNYVKI